jgi:spore coat protein U-like protein
MTSCRTPSFFLRCVFIFSLFGCWLLPGAARADTCTATMTDVVFGNVNPIAGSDYFASGTLTVNCTYTPLGTTGALGLLLPAVSMCATLGGPAGMRSMSNGGNTLPFNLYTDSTYAPASVWGTGTTSGTSSFNGSATGLVSVGTASASYTVYGKIPGSAIGTVRTVGNAATAYSMNFSGLGTVRYAFGTLVNAGCTTGASTTFAFQARATVVNDCRITAGSLAFGNVGVLNGAVRANTTLGVQCTAGSAYQIAFNSGTYGSGATRRMKNASTGELVNYQVSSVLDGANWGDGTTGIAAGGTGTGALQSLPLYGRVTAQKTPSPGDYKDTVTATLYF